MTDKIPEALAVLDEIARGMDDFCQIKYGEHSPQAERLRNVSSAFAELIDAAKEMESDAAILGMGCRRMNASLAAVENLP